MKIYTEKENKLKSEEKNLGVGIEVDAYFLLENNKKHIPKLSIMAVDSLQNHLFIHSRYIKKITSVYKERIDKQTSRIRYIDRAILYEEGLSKEIIASKNEDLYRKRERTKKRRENEKKIDDLTTSPEGILKIGCYGIGIMVFAAIIYNPG